jgi:hypothetical protein
MSIGDQSILTKLVEVFLSFVTSIGVFAIAYNWLNKRGRRHFTFNADVLAAQKEAVRAELARDLELIEKHLGLVRQLLYALNSREAILLPESAPGEAVLFSGLKFSFHLGPTSPNTPPQCFASIFDAAGDRIDEFMMPDNTWIPVS